MTNQINRTSDVKAAAESPATRTMRAAVFAGPGDIQIAEVPIREPGPGEVLVKLEGCGVCGSNLPVYEGRPWFHYPLEPGAPGHEGWGVVDTVGPGVTGTSAGDRVAILSQHAYAEYDTVDAASVVVLPPELRGKPFPGEPLGCAGNVMARSDVRGGQTVAVVGIGFLGALLTGLAAHTGARVIAISRRASALAVAGQLGAAETIELRDHGEIIARVGKLTSGHLCDRVIEAVGLQGPLDLASELTCVRGRLIVAGYHQDGLRTVNMQLWNWRGIDVINAHERDQSRYVDGIRMAANATTSGLIDPEPLCTHRFSLDNLAGAFETMKQRPEGFIKALVLP